MKNVFGLALPGADVAPADGRNRAITEVPERIRARRTTLAAPAVDTDLGV